MDAIMVSTQKKAHPNSVSKKLRTNIGYYQKIIIIIYYHIIQNYANLLLTQFDVLLYNENLIYGLKLKDNLINGTVNRYMYVLLISRMVIY